MDPRLMVEIAEKKLRLSMYYNREQDLWWAAVYSQEYDSVSAARNAGQIVGNACDTKYRDAVWRAFQRYTDYLDRARG